MKDKFINNVTDWRKVYGTWIVWFFYSIILFALASFLEYDSSIRFGVKIIIALLAAIMSILTIIAAIYLLIKKQWLDSLLLFLISPIPFLIIRLLVIVHKYIHNFS